LFYFYIVSSLIKAQEEMKFPSRRAGLFYFYKTVQEEGREARQAVSIPTSGIVLFLLGGVVVKNLFWILSVSIPTSGIVLFLQEQRWDFAESIFRGFHPDERDCSVSTATSSGQKH